MDTTDGQVFSYHTFLKNFISNVNPEDQLPVKINNYNITSVEVIGGVIDWILQYLDSWKCPQTLVSPLAKIIIDEIKPGILDINVCPYYNEEKREYAAIPLMQYVIGVVRRICKLYLESEKITSLVCSKSIYYTSVFAAKNRRRSMEDRYVIIHDLQKLFDIKNYGPIDYYAVFDGHNGFAAATYSAAHLHQYLAESQFYPVYPEQALCEAFKATDKYLLQKEDPSITRSGTTAVCILWHKTDKMLYTAWAGDSEAILVKKGRIYPLVEPHKANREDERKRVQESGGVVLFWQMMWRVNGQLAVTRAIGDCEHKHCITSEPDVRSVQLNGDEDFVIIACDGLWDSVKYEEAAHIVYNKILTTPDDYDEVSQLLVQRAKANGSEDNITVIVVYLLDPHHINFPSADMETATAESFSPKQNGSSYCSINNLQNNFDPEDDFGPETNIDNIDDGLLSQPVSTNKMFANIEALNNGFDTETLQNNSETGNKEAEANAIDNKNVLSDESDDEEWNYFKGQKSGVNSETNIQSSQPLENSAGEEIDYALNPDAAEFVPITPNSNISPVGVKVSEEEEENDSTTAIINELAPVVLDRHLNDEFVASSPLKGQEKSMENIEVPLLNEFDEEIRSRPNNVFLDIDPNNEISFWNNGDVCPLNKKEDSAETATPNDTSVSIQAVLSDDSSFSNNLNETNEALEESIYESEKLAEKLNGFNVLPPSGTSVFDSEKSDVLNVLRPTSTSIYECEKPDVSNVFPHSSTIDTQTNRDVFDNEDYPSIVEKEVYLPNETIHESDVLSSNIEESKPSFETITFANTDDTASVLRGMIDFAENKPTHSTVIVDGQPVFKANSKTPSPVDELLYAHSSYSNNPFSFSNGEEKENAEEKEIRAVGSTSTNMNDIVDFICQRQVAEPIFNLDRQPLADDPFSLKCDGEESQMQSTHVVEMNAEPSKNKAPTAPSCQQTQTMEQSLASQILLPNEISASGIDQDNGVTSSDNTEDGDPMTQYDAETPYRHDCSRMNEKQDSVHPEHTHAKRYADLTPDFNQTSTMESDKLESELRETEAKGLLSHDLQLESMERNQVEESALMEDSMVIVPEILETEPLMISPEISDVPAAAAVVAATVAVAAVTVGAENEAKKSVIKKPAEEKLKVSAKATTKPASNILNKSKSATPFKPSTESKKPSTTVPRTTVPVSRTGTTVAARPASKITNASTRNPLPAKPSAPAKAAVGSTTGVRLTATGKVSNSSVNSMVTTTSSAKTTVTNGNISSSKLSTTRKVLGSNSLPPKKTLTESVNLSTTKPSINMSTRTSLAPKPKPATSCTAKSPSSTMSAVKRSASASKVSNKDSKDITNNRLSSSKSSPIKTATNSINSKTESNLSSNLKSDPAAKTTSSTMPIKKPSSTANSNHSIVTEHQI